MEHTNNPAVPTPQPAKHQVVDPEVSKEKFNQETCTFIASLPVNRKRGIVLLDCSFPDIKIAFCAPQIRPVPVIFAVNINFTNYDLEPLSVKFIHPLTFALINIQELNGHPFGIFKGIKNGVPEVQSLLLPGRDGLPFICLPGIREYHGHPDHSNDPWLTHRGIGGEGSLGFIVDKLHQYGISPIKNLQVNVNFLNAGVSLDINKMPRPS